jgi:TRAP-type mannitol/chloroaromatic compound transport system permease small subunit
MAMMRILDRLVGVSVAIGQWLTLPLIVLLFLQWPLRDVIRGYSREANDLGQVIFALYVAISVTAATRAGTHLAADALARHYSSRLRGTLRRFGVLIGLVPWALFVLFASRGLVGSSIAQLEGFPDTNNPAYFVLKAALWVMTFLVLAQAAVDVVKPVPAGDS